MTCTETKDTSSHYFTQCYTPGYKRTCLSRKFCPCPYVAAHAACNCHLLAYAPFSSPSSPFLLLTQRAYHALLTTTSPKHVRISQGDHSLSAPSRNSRPLTIDLHSIHTKPLSTSHIVFYNMLICSITFCTAFATLGERPTPAVKFLPSMAYTIRRGGSCCNARASPMASATPKAWVE